MSDQKRKKTSIGGQTVIEGVMMRGVDRSAMAVRRESGEIVVEQWEHKASSSVWYKRTPLIRGIFNFVDQMISGYKCIMRSAELSGMDLEEEPSPFEQKLEKLFGEHLVKVLYGVASVLGVLLAVGLFMILPTAISKGVNFLAGGAIANAGLSLLEGGIKIAVFVSYMALVRRMPEMYRMFSYHGAEHKTIACYEAGEELTVENVRRHIRFHPRCGTSFLLIVLVISILVFSVVTWQNGILRVVLKLLLLPVVVSISYEIIKLAGRYDNLVTRIISKPGLWLQRLTTVEPDDSMIEVAIASMKPVIPKEEGVDNW